MQTGSVSIQASRMLRIVAFCSPAFFAAIARAMQRDKLPQPTVESRLDAQLSNAQRIARAGVVIDNNGTPDAMQAQLRCHWLRLNA